MVELGQVNLTPSLSRETMEILYGMLELCMEDADAKLRLDILHEITDRQEALIALVPRLVGHLPVPSMSAIWAYLKSYAVPDVTCQMIHTAMAQHGYYMFNDANCTVEYFRLDTSSDQRRKPVTDPYDYYYLDQKDSVMRAIDKRQK